MSLKEVIDKEKEIMFSSLVERTTINGGLSFSHYHINDYLMEAVAVLRLEVKRLEKKVDELERTTYKAPMHHTP